MSMISAQINELRLIADKDTVPYEASDAMYQAADTIWQLRDDLQRANAAVQDAERDESMAWDRVRKAEAENAKLRSQCTDLVDERERLFQANVEKNGEALRLVGENAKLREERRECQATIDSLVDECADYKAENAKLREQIHWLKRGDVLHVLTDQELADQQKHEREMQASITALDAENAKLRELVAVIWRFTGTACKKYPRLFDPAAQGGQIMQLNMIEVFEQRMHELGIEV